MSEAQTSQLVVGAETPFNFRGLSVRVIERDGEAWFVAADICEALGLSNPSVAVRGLEEDELALSTAYTNAGQRNVTIVSESGLYALIFKSRKAEAVAFRKWVTSEVLPAIRRTGRFDPDGVALRFAERLAALEARAAPLTPPPASGPPATGPMWNPVTGRAWGLADLALLHAAGRASQDWATRKQWARLGRRVAYGAQPVLVWFTRGAEPGMGPNTMPVYNEEQTEPEFS